MKNLSFLLIFFVTINMFSQNKRFIYEYKYVPDSTNSKNIISETMFLDSSQNGSEFYGYEKFKSDSLMAEELKRGIASPPPMRQFISYRILKKIQSTKQDFIIPLSSNLYIVKDERKIKWKLFPEYSTILNYKVQKASCEFAGRQWEVWFAEDIPIQDGPYKFRGLPGLILKANDKTNSHIFEIKAIESIKNNSEYPLIKNYAQKFDVDQKQYAKIFKNYRKNPAADLIGKIPDYKDSEGNFVSGQQKVREIEKMMTEKFELDNNILEIDLLK